MKLGLTSLTETLNRWAGDKLDSEEFSEFFSFIWNRWRDESDLSGLDFANEWRLFRGGN